ncbi:protein I'm not dead yet-like [Vespula squamosa]|uniref:Protein I'm not dead yet-like n=1 Tax=Vespula squamosa TaxID=30214 RepID=A0ABD2B215_VESSQ
MDKQFWINTGNFFRLYWRMIFALSWFILLTTLLIIYNCSEVRCAFVILLMAGYWMTEAIPIPITSMIPVALFPIFGIMSTIETVNCYMNDPIMVFMGGLILAFATEHCNLHIRIALLVMKMVGCSHTKLLGGLCTVTTFISMWIANAATTAMMVPIVFAVLYELERQGLGKVFHVIIDPNEPDADPILIPTNVTKAYFFAAAYAATFGGTGTLVGTPTNLVFKGIYEYTFPDADPITFGTWIAACFPQMAVNSFVLWIHLQIVYLGFLRPKSKDAKAATIGPEGEKIANEVIKQKLKEIGPMSFHEISVSILFLTCIFLWIFRAPGFITGWAKYVSDVEIKDSTAVILICLVMLYIPRDPDFIYFWSRDPEKRPWGTSEGLITWNVIQRKMPWRLIFLLGGGFAISKGSNKSCLATKIGQSLLPLKHLPPIPLLFIILLFIGTLTEITSNVGTANIVIPIVAHMCSAMKIHPLYLMVPATVTCSYAFRLPVSTPPNAIISIAAHIRTPILLVGGCLPAMYSLLVQILIFPFWGTFILGLDKFPEWAEKRVASEVRCAFVVLIMAAYWITEVFPMAITSLLPIVLFPCFGVLSTAQACSCYMNDTIMVFIGGLILAVAIEHCNLHLRIALGVMKMLGCSHARLLGGLCVVTTFISMWVSNTAATAMMIPIIFAILQELEEVCDFLILPLLYLLVILLSLLLFFRLDLLKCSQNTLLPSKVTMSYLLITAYSATFGGTGTIVGTGTNLTFKGIFESTFPTAGGINFTDWMIASFPQMVLNSFCTWLYVRIVFLGYLRPRSKDALAATIGKEGEIIANNVVKARYKELGPLSFHEFGIAVLFIMCIFLWIFRKPGFIVGWSEYLTDIEIKDSTPVILTSILMFFIPKDPTFIHFWSKDPKKRPVKTSEGLITWKVIESKMPWSLMFLLGGGFAISKGSIHSSLAKKIGEALTPLKTLPPIAILICICSFVGTITEFTSNVGIANITLPVIAQMSIAMELHPIYLMIPATYMCSFSFRLPVGTPPNALVTVAGHIPTKWLILAGCIPSLYSLLIQIILFPTWGVYVYDISFFPDWAKDAQLEDN